MPMKDYPLLLDPLMIFLLGENMPWIWPFWLLTIWLPR